MKNLEQEIILHGAPTLASIKAANLIGYRFEDEDRLYQEVESIRDGLRPKGLELTILSNRCGYALIYLYRLRDLECILSLEESQEILYKLGYFYMDTETAIKQLRNRIKSSEGFPHEIGLFLGYPLKDVEGFMRDRGRSCTCAGLWKSYCNPEEAKREFRRLEHCMEVYGNVYKTGRSLIQLTVAS